MFKLKSLSITFTTILLMVLLAACEKDKKDDDDDNPPASSPPTVVSTFPNAGATGVALNTNVIARFSEPMLSSSITAANFTLTGPGATPVAGTVSYDAINRVADFLPTGALAASTLFTARVSIGAQDAAGTPMANPYTWTFTTGITADTTAPTVNSVNPLSLATGVPINQNITAVFSEQMDSATVTTTSFTLMNGVTPIAGAVSCPGSTATFNPTANLPAGVTITARITVLVRDLANNPMAADFVWTFDTGAGASNGPPTVVLGTAANYVVLAKSGVSTTGTTAVTGDVGLSPADRTYLTGFSETMDSTNEFSTSPYVTGSLFAADYTPPTPTIMTTAVLDMETAYNDAKNRVTPDYLNLGAGNVQGMTLAPGLYNWGTSLSIPSAVTLSGGANDVWIFQIAGDLLVGNGAIVTLTGALPQNVFWQVTGQATLGTTSNFKGIVLCATAIVLQNGAIMNGRALAQTAVTMDATAITEP